MPAYRRAGWRLNGALVSAWLGALPKGSPSFSDVSCHVSSDNDVDGLIMLGTIFNYLARNQRRGRSLPEDAALA